MKLTVDLFVERRLGTPQIKIIIDDYLTLYSGDAQEHFEFTVDLPSGGHDLKIVHFDKQPDHHLYDEHGTVTVDRHVEILGIAFDDVALERELWAGKFFPVYMHKADHEPYSISPNLYLGHNGTWQLEFVTPALPWLIATRKSGPQLDNTIFQTNAAMLQQAKNFFRDLPDV